MELPIKIQSIEKDISECAHLLDFLKKLTSLNKDLQEYTFLNEIVTQVLDVNLTNAHCVTTVSQLEISLTLKSLYNSNNELEKKQVLKNGVLIIYESIKTIEKFNKVLLEYSKSNPLLKHGYENYTKELKEFKRIVRFDREFKNIRNQIAGHITDDFVEYSRHLDSINIERVTDNLINYRFIINRLNQYLFKCVSLKSSSFILP